MAQSMKSSARVTLSDLEALIRLAGEAGEIGRDARQRRSHILASLAKLCHAEKGVYATFRRPTVEQQRWVVRRNAVIFLNTSAGELHRMRHFYELGEPADPIIDLMANSEEPIIVSTPQHYMTDDAWRRTPHYNEVRKPSQIRQQLYARYGGDQFCRHGVGLHRRENIPFGRRELDLAHIFMRNAGHLLCDPGDDETTESQPLGVRLPPRLRPVLERYLAGESEKEAAASLGLSPQTVHTYAKQLYRAIGVSSRAELMARFINGAPRQ